MGICASGIDAEAAAENAAVEEMIEASQNKDSEVLKILLLGAGESGRSTIFKQMKILYGNETMTQVERNIAKQIIHNNIMTTIQTILDFVDLFEVMDDLAPENKDHYDLIIDADDSAMITEEMGDAIHCLWSDPAVKKVWDRRAETQIVESLEYYFTNVERITRDDYMNKPEYSPSDLSQYKQDILLARVRTSGMVTESYTIDGRKFEMYDVGGQRNERRKWIACFDSVTAVIFIAAISEYDQKLFEDQTTNRMLEALELFDEVVNDSHFAKAAMILFLNKKDLFEKKIERVPIEETPAFKDYTGGPDFKAGCKYFAKKFMKKVPAGHACYHHITCATDSQNVSIVFDSCKDIIVNKNLAESGML